MTKTLKLLVCVELEIPEGVSETDAMFCGTVDFTLDKEWEGKIEVLSVSPEYPDQLDDSDDWGLGGDDNDE